MRGRFSCLKKPSQRGPADELDGGFLQLHAILTATFLLWFKSGSIQTTSRCTLYLNFPYDQGTEKDFNLINIQMSVLHGNNQWNMYETEQYLKMTTKYRTICSIDLLPFAAQKCTNCFFSPPVTVRQHLDYSLLYNLTTISLILGKTHQE